MDGRRTRLEPQHAHPHFRKTPSPPPPPSRPRGSTQVPATPGPPAPSFLAPPLSLLSPSAPLLRRCICTLPPPSHNPVASCEDPAGGGVAGDRNADTPVWGIFCARPLWCQWVRGDDTHVSRISARSHFPAISCISLGFSRLIYSRFFVLASRVCGTHRPKAYTLATLPRTFIHIYISNLKKNKMKIRDYYVDIVQVFLPAKL